MRQGIEQRKEERQFKRHTDRTIYVVWVLWVLGMSEVNIAAITAKKRKQISGIVARSPYSNRSAMTREERQQAYDELFSVRMDDNGKPVDGGILDRVPTRVMDLRGRQVRQRTR